MSPVPDIENCLDPSHFRSDFASTEPSLAHTIVNKNRINDGPSTGQTNTEEIATNYGGCLVPGTRDSLKNFGRSFGARLELCATTLPSLVKIIINSTISIYRWPANSEESDNDSSGRLISRFGHAATVIVSAFLVILYLIIIVFAVNYLTNLFDNEELLLPSLCMAVSTLFVARFCHFLANEVII